jgi:LacI family transcriptional regulator
MSNAHPKKKVTQHDVARHAGVSRSMVSYVLNGSTRAVAPETRDRILQAIDALEYRPNKFAQALMRGRAEAVADRHIGVILCNSEVFLRPYYAEILAGIHAASHEKSYHIRFIRFFDELKDPLLFNQLIHQEEVCGLLLVATDQCLKTDEDWNIIRRIRERIDQIVCVEWRTAGLASVFFDRYATARKATDYLFDQGYRDIAYIGELDERISGFKQAFLSHGVDDVSALYIDNARDMPSGYTAMKTLFHSCQNQMKRLPRAICAGSDEVAIGILKFLHEKNIKIPEETGVISIDNIEVAEYTTPPLTTMNIQKQAMGRQAVELIVHRRAYQGDGALSISLQPTLIIRESS